MKIPSVKDFAVGVGLWEDDKKSAGGYQSPPAQPMQPIAQAAVQTAPAAQTGSADATMVNNLRTQVLGASPIVTQFMQNVDLVRAQFPNDETACMKAALAFTRVDKATLFGELDRTVAATLLQVKKGSERERKKARDAAVGSLEQDLSKATEEINGMQARVVELQQSIAQKQAQAGQLQEKVRDAEADLLRQDGVVNASFAQVEQSIALLKQTFAKL